MRKDLLKIIEHYGVFNQARKFNEESYELIEAIFQYDAQKEACENIGCSRLHVDKCREHIEEEIADVMVMLNQFIEYYNIDRTDIELIMDKKIKRQIGRIENE